MCWDLSALRSGGRTTTYDTSKSDTTLADALVMKTGISGDRVCVEDWDLFEFGRDYELVVEGVSELFGTVGEERMMISLQDDDEGKKRATRQDKVGCGLWESDGEDLYGIRTYPSGKSYLPFSARGEGLMVLMKGLIGCAELEMGKEILAEGEVKWEFEGWGDGELGGKEADEYADGTRLYIPPDVLLANVPASEWVGVRVTLELDNDKEFSANFSFQFSPGRVEFELNNDPGQVIVSDSRLVFDLSPSFTQDEERGLAEDGLEWEWDWECTNPLTGDVCVYRNGDVVVMPGRSESVFEGGGGPGGEEFVVGEAMMFVVRVRVIGDNGGVSRGRWRTVVSFVEEEVDYSVRFSEWWCLFGQGQYGYNVCLSLFFSSFSLLFCFVLFCFVLFSVLFCSVLFCSVHFKI